MPEQNRDTAFEGLLREVLRAEPNLPSQPCVELEVLAAWADGTLRAQDASLVEQHVSTCARCQAVSAALIRTPAAAPGESVWRRWRLAWLVPVATAAVTVAVWVAIPQRAGTPAEPVERATASVPEQSSTVPSSPAPLPSTTPPAATGTAPGPSATFAAKSEARVEADRQATSVPEAAPSINEGQSPPETGNRAFDTARTEPPTPAESAARADRVTAATAEAPASPPAAREQLAKGGAAALAGSPGVEVVASGGVSRWRITAGGRQVEFAASGTNWQPATGPWTSAVLAGSAPSASTCWLVGRAGGVYLSTDGVRFVRLAFPESVDLVAVSATDDRGAVVTAADGRSWRTTDQGRTWR
jgi:hypothetical protein